MITKRNYRKLKIYTRIPSKFIDSFIFFQIKLNVTHLRCFSLFRLVLRIRSDANVAQILLGNKFGCDLKTEAPILLKQARNLNLDVVGVCFHVGSGCGEPEAFGRSIAAASELFELGRQFGFDMRLLDIGGGFHGRKNSSLDEVSLWKFHGGCFNKNNSEPLLLLTGC